MKRLPKAKYSVLDIYLTGGNKVRIKCKDFYANNDGNYVSTWRAEGIKPGHQFWFNAASIAGVKLIRMTWW